MQPSDSAMGNIIVIIGSFHRSRKSTVVEQMSVFSDDRTTPTANRVSYYSFSFEILIHGGYICGGYICKTFPEHRGVSFVYLTLSQCCVNGRSRRGLMPLICMCNWLHNVEARMQKICFDYALCKHFSFKVSG